MSWITEPKLVSAVCNAGGLGIFATGPCTPEETRRQIREIRELTDKPFGIGQSLNMPGARKNIEVAIEEKVPVINYALGKPWFVEQVHEYGGKIIGTVALVRHAIRAAQLGCDALSVTGHEAAAHGADATSLILIPLCASAVKIPLLAAGGFFDGRGLAAALVLGADAISMGTRFALTKESILHENFKQLVLKATEQDTLYSTRFDGMPDRVLKSKGAEVVMRRWWPPLLEGLAGARYVKRILKLSWWDIFLSSLKLTKSEEGLNILQQLRFGISVPAQERAIFDGDEAHGFLPSGQSQGGINGIPSVSEVIEQIVTEAEKVLEAVREKVHA